MNKKQEELTQLLQPTVEMMGYEWIGLDYLLQGRHSLLRVYVDKEGGVTAGDCGRISHQLGAVLDVENPIVNRYTLEVSSPGLNRPLFTLAHFKKQIGKTVAIHTIEPVQEQKNFKGTIQAVNNEQIVILSDEARVELPFKIIQKAHLLFVDQF